MNELPIEVMEKINEKYPTSNSNWTLMPEKKAAEYGYRLACALCEGKEKEIAELKKGANKDSDSLAAIAIEYNKRLSEISSLEAEKDCYKKMLTEILLQIEYGEKLIPIEQRVAHVFNENPKVIIGHNAEDKSVGILYNL